MRYKFKKRIQKIRITPVIKSKRHLLEVRIIILFNPVPRSITFAIHKIKRTYFPSLYFGGRILKRLSILLQINTNSTNAAINRLIDDFA